jgi:hypothetical protein
MHLVQAKTSSVDDSMQFSAFKKIILTIIITIFGELFLRNNILSAVYQKLSLSFCLYFVAYVHWFVSFTNHSILPSFGYTNNIILHQ